MKRYELFIESENWAHAERYYIASEEYPDGTWVKWEDVQELEASSAKLTTKYAELELASQVIAARHANLSMDYATLSKDNAELLAALQSLAEREMIPIPEITIVETEGYDPRERYLVELNGNFMGSYSDLEKADARVTELKRILNISQT